MILIIEKYSSMLLGALGKTVLLTLLSLIFAMVVGMIFALMNVGKNRILNCIGTIYVDAVRGVPLIVLAYFIFFGVPQGIKSLGFQDFRLTALQAGTIALAMNCGAYMAEIIRAGIESVDKGQMEAGRSLGLNYVSTMRYIIIPQAFKNVLPALGNELITLLKETSIVTVIGLKDLTKGAMIIQANTYQALVPFLAIAVMYLALVMLLSWLLGKMERRLRQSDIR